MPRAWIRFLPFSIAVAAGCGGSPAPSTKSPTTESPVPSEKTATPDAGAEPPRGESPRASEGNPGGEPEPGSTVPKVTLLDPGQEPRRKLRYAFTSKRETLVIEIEMKMAMRMGDTVSPETELPTIRTTMDIVPKGVSSEGDLSYEGEVVRNEVVSGGAVPALIRNKIEESLKSMRGVKLASTVSSRGVVKDATMQIPDDAMPEMRQTLESTRDALRMMCTPLPEEEVGVGARWRTDSDVRTSFRLVQSTTMTLTKLEQNRMRLDAVLAQSAAAQPILGHGVPAGTTIRLDRLTGKGTGALDVRLDHLTPTSSMSLENETAMTVTAAGQSMPTGSRMHMVVRVKPGK